MSINNSGGVHLLILINPSGQSLVIYLDQKMHSSLVIKALGSNRPWASSLFYIYWFHYEMFGKIMSCKFEYLNVVWISCFGDICKVSDNNFLPPALSVTNYILFWWEEVYFSLNQWRFRVITTWPITGIKVGSFRCLWFQSSFPSLQWK